MNPRARRNADRGQRFRHPAGAFGAPLAHPGNARRQRRIGWINIQADDMHSNVASPSHRNFHTIDELHAVLYRHRARLIEAGHVVVVRQRQDFHAAFGCMRHQLGGRQQPVRHGGVAM